MRALTTLLLAACLVLALAACTQTGTTGTSQPATPAPSTAEPSQTTPPAQSAAPNPPTATGLWDSTLSSQTYRSWAKAPGYDTPQPGKGPHGKTVQVFVNDMVSKTLAGTGATAWPVGSQIVKDAFDASGKQITVEYMQKTDSGWYFASYDMTGKILKEGNEVAPCAPCHENKSSDGVKSFTLPQ